MNTRVKVSEIAAERVSFSYGAGVMAVEVMSVHVRAGERVMVVGPNGCGKSTLLRMLVGEIAPIAGKILIEGKDAREIRRSEIAQRISLVPQQSAGGIGFGYTVREMVLMARYAGSGMMGMGFETSEDLEIANKAMWASDVHHLAERAVTTLSGGERQRVAIARAMTQDTGIMLLDEPTSALDLHHQLELMEQLRVMTAEEGRGVLMVTHDLNLAAKHATRVIVMDRGKVVADGAPAEVLTAAVLEPVYRVQVRREGAALVFERRV